MEWEADEKWDMDQEIVMQERWERMVGEGDGDTEGVKKIDLSYVKEMATRKLCEWTRVAILPVTENKMFGLINIFNFSLSLGKFICASHL